MDELAKEYIVDFFSKKLMLFGNAPAAVGWTEAGQRLRYECIDRLLPLKGASLLDFGCGKGDFYSFLKEKGINAEYTGMDINQKLIETASRNFPDAEFLTLDIDTDNIPGTYDYIISCGVFNLNLQGVKEAAAEAFEKGELKERVLKVVQAHPGGIKLSEIGKALKIAYVQAAKPIKDLLSEVKITKRDSEYLPA